MKCSPTEDKIVSIELALLCLGVKMLNISPKAKKAATLCMSFLLEINHSGTICPPLQINAAPSVHKLLLPILYLKRRRSKDEPRGGWCNSFVSKLSWLSGTN